MIIRNGFTLPEVMIALAVIMITLAALGFSQLNNLRASAASNLATETKSAANVALETLLADVLTIKTAPPAGQSIFRFYDFYWSCPSAATPPVGSPTVGTATCSGTRTIGGVGIAWSIRGESGVLGEGVLTITVTANHNMGTQRITIGDRITCYDVYPSPTSTAPEPCPVPTAAGGGRP